MFIIIHPVAFVNALLRTVLHAAARTELTKHKSCIAGYMPITLFLMESLNKYCIRISFSQNQSANDGFF